MTDHGDNPGYALFCSTLDAWADAVALGCNVVRASFVVRGHGEAYQDWEDRRAPCSGSLTGTEPPAPPRDDLNGRAQRLLARYVQDEAFWDQPAPDSFPLKVAGKD